ncbi:AAA family ATPase [Clostridium estertheticum]|uniref:McrB family protein n=1 Tax=Clostridium estertheticum TaxID=238834 RepID=UPI0013EE6215|nr:AAA family ATPase [Clostridium estertheticum]MBZ9607554.1 AAA family ATPase [Clostridium estertheticum]
MALINKNNIKRIDRKTNKIHSEVNGSYSVFINKDGKQFLQIDTYGSPDRKIQEKVSQSIQFNRETGEFLLNLLRSNKNTTIKNADKLEDVETIKNKIKNIEEYVKKKSFIYSNAAICNFYLSLKTKPFVILAGISGTGKSKLVKLFASAIGATSENGQYNIISVKPDWNDSTELFGYKNINDEFVPGKLTEIIFRASKEENINKPYFICLDEMNLARVEYYLSEYLSIIESRELDENNNIKTDRLFSKGYLAEGNEYANLRIPENIYIVGTVNMDDTTFAFSRKVLDRANTIEFSDVDLDALDFSNEECESINVDNDFFKTSFLTIKDALNSDDAFVRQTNSKVKDINEILEQGNKNFGYRVRDEIVFYMLENKINDLLSEDEAFDFQIMQKILPIITGSELVIKDILIKLFNYCNTSGKEVTASLDYIEDCETELKSGNIKYKKSAKKILMMLRGYDDGFTSFWA